MTAPWVVAFALLWVVVLLVAVLVLGMFRRAVNVLEQAESRFKASTMDSVMGGLPPGSRVPDFEMVDHDGALILFSDHPLGPAVYVFLSIDCEPCHALLDNIRREGLHVGPVAFVAVIDDISQGRALELPEGIRPIYQRAGSVSSAFQTTATPHAFAVDRNGVVVDVTIPNSVDDLVRLAEALARAEPETSRQVGIRDSRATDVMPPGGSSSQ